MTAMSNRVVLSHTFVMGSNGSKLCLTRAAACWKMITQPEALSQTDVASAFGTGNICIVCAGHAANCIGCVRICG